MRLGNALRSLRRAQAISQEELADRSGVHVTSIRDYEQGRTAPSWHTLTQLAQGLRLTMDEIGQAYDRSSARARDAKDRAPPPWARLKCCWYSRPALLAACPDPRRGNPRGRKLDELARSHPGRDHA